MGHTLWAVLSIQLGSIYKLCVLVYKALRNSAPRYLSELVVPIASTVTSRRLRSMDSHCIIEPRSRLKFGDRGFSVAAPQAWNSLPLHVKTAPSLALFTERLKTELFSRSYPPPVSSSIVYCRQLLSYFSFKVS